MPLWQIAFVLWPFAAVVAALIVADALRSADAHTAPDGTAGDLLADQPTEIVRMSDAEIDRRIKRIELFL